MSPTRGRGAGACPCRAGLSGGRGVAGSLGQPSPRVRRAAVVRWAPRPSPPRAALGHRQRARGAETGPFPSRWNSGWSATSRRCRGRPQGRRRRPASPRREAGIGVPVSTPAGCSRTARGPFAGDPAPPQVRQGFIDDRPGSPEQGGAGALTVKKPCCARTLPMPGTGWGRCGSGAPLGAEASQAGAGTHGKEGTGDLLGQTPPEIRPFFETEFFS